MTIIFSVLAIGVLILASAFFSASETSLMALNRYRLKHLAKKSASAKRAEHLLTRPDRLLGMILIGNTFANILVSSIATLEASRYFGDVGVLVLTLILTLVVLLFSEIMPKTLAALQPERLAFKVSGVLTFLLKLLSPLVWLLNIIANGILRLLGVDVRAHKINDPLTAEELKSVVHASSEHIEAHKHMLLGVLELEQASVKDAMLPRQSIVGLDLETSWVELLHKIHHSAYSKLPVYRTEVNNIVGILELKKLIGLSFDANEGPQALEALLSPAYFIPETISLHQQLLNFKQNAKQMALVVDEYGDLQGLVTVEDILEEIVGEFASVTQPSVHAHTCKLEDGSYIVDGAMTLRDLNRDLNLELPLQGPKTLSGLLVTHLDAIPEANACVEIAGYPMEILALDETSVKSVRIFALKA